MRVLVAPLLHDRQRIFDMFVGRRISVGIKHFAVWRDDVGDPIRHRLARRDRGRPHGVIGANDGQRGVGCDRELVAAFFSNWLSALAAAALCLSIPVNFTEVAPPASHKLISC